MSKDTTMNGTYTLGALLFILGLVCIAVLDTKIPAIVLIVLAAFVFLQAQNQARRR